MAAPAPNIVVSSANDGISSPDSDASTTRDNASLLENVATDANGDAKAVVANVVTANDSASQAPDSTVNNKADEVDSSTVAAGCSTLPPPKRSAAPRKKVALAPGCSHLDWMRLTASGVDLSGVGGRLRGYTRAEVRQHRTVDDCWLVYRGRIYNVTPYLKFHPGGVKEVMKGAGKDATKLIDKIHAWVNVENMLARCLVGGLIEED